MQVSSVELERICNAVDSSILETAAIGVPPLQGGPERLVIAVVFKNANNSTPDLEELKKSFNSAVQKKLNPLFRVFPDALSAAPLLFEIKTWIFWNSCGYIMVTFAGFSCDISSFSTKDGNKQGDEKDFAAAICSRRTKF